MPCLKAKTNPDSLSDIPVDGNIPVEVEDTFEPSQPHDQPETSRGSDIPTSEQPETSTPESENSDEDDEDHPGAQAQALRDYQRSRDRVRRETRKPARYGYSYIVSYACAATSYIEEKEPLAGRVSLSVHFSVRPFGTPTHSSVPANSRVTVYVTAVRGKGVLDERDREFPSLRPPVTKGFFLFFTGRTLRAVLHRGC
ncbi:hypothetical protein M9H77_03403 [Catharanthus roseus]|uniref:Uncharacterized protein n=1 Tax=Catharanthus roseus TaxID=4058 RepID=A0ACC0CB70_CATRO|nr:hypothetical protein M9H77_03403 [Catharanthus roseus]